MEIYIKKRRFEGEKGREFGWIWMGGEGGRDFERGGDMSPLGDFLGDFYFSLFYSIYVSDLLDRIYKSPSRKK